MARVMGVQNVPAGIFAGPNAATRRVTNTRRARTVLGGGNVTPRRGARVGGTRGGRNGSATKTRVSSQTPQAPRIGALRRLGQRVANVGRRAIARIPGLGRGVRG